ncbi:protein RGF1 INDUCIBLE TRANSCRIPTION FACTOR 1-like [Rutidosis leptorrhynchoides]|uniref:protein RGF1 INDUCIBLE TRANSCRIPTION FACTOR 1-like n=1 Tax=Rutidosis leptorrhynchoides TaxID=125765 RepID=UPI003A9907E1
MENSQVAHGGSIPSHRVIDCDREGAAPTLWNDYFSENPRYNEPMFYGRHLNSSHGIEKPAWLDALCTEKFFVGCRYHESLKKNEKNVCCLDCCTSNCPHCVSSHRHHRLLQVRRYVYHDVVRLEDLEKLINCSNVQAYTINGAKVVFIKKRPQNRQFKGAVNYCTSCDRSLQEPFIHCSLGCKVDFLLKHYKDLSPFLKKCKTLTLGPDFLFPQEMIGSSGDEEMTDESPNSTIVNSTEEQMSWSSDSSGTLENYMMSPIACTVIVRKRRSALIYNKDDITSSDHDSNIIEDMATSMSNRRKGIPQRSPLC